MKKLLLVVGTLFSFILIGPKVVGTIIGNEYANIAERMQQHSTVDIENVVFEHDWFTGQSSFEFKFKGLAELDAFSLKVTENLNFGPIIFSDNGVEFALSSASVNFSLNGLPADEEFDALLNKIKEATKITSQITYNFDYVASFKVDEMMHEQDNHYVKFHSLVSEISLSDNTFYTGEVEWQGLTVDTQELKMTIAPVNINFDSEVIAGDIYAGTALLIGDAKIALGQVNAHDGQGNELLLINNLLLTSKTEEQGDLINININYHMDDIQTYGLTFQHANLDMSFNSLNKQVLIELNQLAAQLQMTTAPENFEQEFQKLIPIAAKFLKNDPAILVNDLSLQTEEGTIKSNGSIKIDNTLVDMNNPMSFIGALTAVAKGEASEKLLEKFGLKSMLNMYVEQGLLIREQDNLSFSVEFSHENLKINGNQIPL